MPVTTLRFLGDRHSCCGIKFERNNKNVDADNCGLDSRGHVFALTPGLSKKGLVRRAVWQHHSTVPCWLTILKRKDVNSVEKTYYDSDFLPDILLNHNL